MRKKIVILTAFLFSAGLCLAVCPSADLTGDCFVDFNDFAILAANWPATDYNDLALLAAEWLAPDPRVPDDMTYIPGGTFEMGDNLGDGSSDELPVHTVTVNSFYMAKYEITNGQYCDYLNSAQSQGLIIVIDGVVYQSGTGTTYPYCDTSAADTESQIAYGRGVFSVQSKGGRSMDNDPLVQVSWFGAVAYCNWRSWLEGLKPCYNLSTWDCDFAQKGYHVPTEAQWELAARGGLSGKRFPWGDTISHSQANYHSSTNYGYDVSLTRGYHPTWNDGIYPYTSSVDSLAANGYGLHDMAGNLYEWCNDWYSGSYYSSSPSNNPTGPPSGVSRILRGGSWNHDANRSRVAERYGLTPETRGYGHGLRIALDSSVIGKMLTYIP